MIESPTNASTIEGEITKETMIGDVNNVIYAKFVEGFYLEHENIFLVDEAFFGKVVAVGCPFRYIFRLIFWNFTR